MFRGIICALERLAGASPVLVLRCVAQLSLQLIISLEETWKASVTWLPRRS